MRPVDLMALTAFLLSRLCSLPVLGFCLNSKMTNFISLFSDGTVVIVSNELIKAEIKNVVKMNATF